MSRFEFSATPLAGLMRVRRKVLADERGSLSRLFDPQEMAAGGWHHPVAQINHTVTRHAGTVRGLHYQLPPHAEHKLVSCVRGEVWDVAVDLRRGSPTFLHWHAERLSADNACALWIPEGFAHGFQALEDGVELVYVHSAPYVAASEAGLSALDPRLAIAWPLPVQGLSARDQAHGLVTDGFSGVLL